MQSDEEIIKKIMEGDRHAATRLIRDTEKLVAHIVFKMINDPSDRNDLVQDIYLKTFRYLPKFRFQSKLSTWVAKISYTTCFDHLRKRQLVIDLPEIQEEQDTVIIKEKAAILERVSHALPPVYRTLITLFHKEELSIDEIMQITGLPAGTVKNYLFRARKMMKEKLLNHYSKDDL
jgi:RNA polymerase sigma-70 factor (ECF subfamily)